MTTLSRRRLLTQDLRAALAAAVLLDGAVATGDGTIDFPDPSVARLLTVGAVLTQDETGNTVLDDVVAGFATESQVDGPVF